MLLKKSESTHQRGVADRTDEAVNHARGGGCREAPASENGDAESTPEDTGHAGDGRESGGEESAMHSLFLAWCRAHDEIVARWLDFPNLRQEPFMACSFQLT